MAQRVPPTQLAKQATNLLKADLLKKPPVWLHAMRAVPPGPSVIRSKNPITNVAALSDAEKELLTSDEQTATKRNKIGTRHKQKHLRSRPPRPVPIVYPEDRLRRQFYKDHPFELARPQVLVENKLGINRTDFSQLMLPGMTPDEVTGETVIKYQLHLMVHEKMPERKAYAKACSEFYEIRAKQEEAEREARAQMNAVVQEYLKQRYTNKVLKREEAALAEGQGALQI